MIKPPLLHLGQNWHILSFLKELKEKGVFIWLILLAGATEWFLTAVSPLAKLDGEFGLWPLWFGNDISIRGFFAIKELLICKSFYI